VVPDTEVKTATERSPSVASLPVTSSAAMTAWTGSVEVRRASRS
jgi:hypothetical protein